MPCCAVHGNQLGDRQTRAQALPSTVRSPVRSTEVYDRGFGGIVWELQRVGWAIPYGIATHARTFGRKGDRTSF